MCGAKQVARGDVAGKVDLVRRDGVDSLCNWRRSAFSATSFDIARKSTQHFAALLSCLRRPSVHRGVRVYLNAAHQAVVSGRVSANTGRTLASSAFETSDCRGCVGNVCVNASRLRLRSAPPCPAAITSPPLGPGERGLNYPNVSPLLTARRCPSSFWCRVRPARARARLQLSLAEHLAQPELLDLA